MFDNEYDSPGDEQYFSSDKDTRRLLDKLLQDSSMYRQSQDYKNLLDFVGKLRDFAPFNAMLLHIQKPGLSYAATAGDWRTRFKRYPKEDARPLLIMWPFSPVALVYDVMDTEGEKLPEDVACFPAKGQITALQMDCFFNLIRKKNIETQLVDTGDRKAGAILVVERGDDKKKATRYHLKINRNHSLPVQFVTLTHELAHLFLGHLGQDKKFDVPKRPRLPHRIQELEAESAAYIVCKRNGIEPKSESYLASFISGDGSMGDIEVYQVMRAAGQIEKVLRLDFRMEII
jgi:hypothetical protein